MLKHIFVAACALAFAAAGVAKLPAPTPEQQATAALNAAKAAHAAKVDAYTLCMSQTKVAESYIKEQKAGGKVYTPEATPACVNPGPFVPPAAPQRRLLRRNLRQWPPRSSDHSPRYKKASHGAPFFVARVSGTGRAITAFDEHQPAVIRRS